MNSFHILILQVIHLLGDSIDAFADKKLTLSEKWKLGTGAAGLAFTNWKEIAGIYKRMTVPQLEALYADVAAEVNITEGEAKVIIGQVLEIAKCLGVIAKTLQK